MRQKRYKGSDASSEEDTSTVIVDFETGYAEEEDDDLATQLVPRPSSTNASSTKSPSKSNSQKTKQSSSTIRTLTASPSKSPGHRNGYRIREVNVSEIPNHLISNMKLAQTARYVEDNLTLDSWNCRNSSAKGGVWIIQCPKDVDAKNLLDGKKISLDGDKSVLDVDDEDDEHDEPKQYETISVDNDEHKNGAMLLLPTSNGFKMVTTPVQGHIIIRESLKDFEMPEVQIPVPKPRVLPSGIKERHPIYGTDFSEILDKMKNAKVKTKTPTKNRPSFPILDTQQKQQHGFSSNYSEVSQTKISNVHDRDESDSSHKNKSKKKRRNDSDASSIADTESHKNDFSTPMDDEDESSSSKRKKSKKRKRSEMDDSYEFIIDFNSPLKKSKKIKI